MLHDLAAMERKSFRIASENWTTPKELLEPLYSVFGAFDLDPCSPTNNGRTAPVRAKSRTLKVRGGIISQANRYLGGFCSSQRIFPPQIIQVLLKVYYTEADDGLSLPWFGHVFCNPPYTYCISRRNFRCGIHLRVR